MEVDSEPCARGGAEIGSAALVGDAVREALDACAAPAVRARILARALLLSGEPSMPSGGAPLMEFVHGPLAVAITGVLGSAAADFVLETLSPVLALAGQPVQSGVRRKKPVRTADGSEGSSSEPGLSGQTPQAGLTRTSTRILYVDDDSAYRESMARLLRLVGYEVLEEVDGPRALQRCLTERPQVVISDYTMPGMNGLELAEQLGLWLGAEAPPVLLVTAIDLDTLALGAVFRAFRKPAPIEELIDALAELVTRSASRRVG